MTEAVSYQLEIKGVQELMNKLSAAVKESVIMESLQEAGVRLASWSVKNRMSGPRPQFLGVVTGRLSTSVYRITAETHPERIGNVYLKRIGTNVEYGPTHEFGDTRRNIPARPFLRPALQEESNVREVLNILTENINEALESK